MDKNISFEKKFMFHDILSVRFLDMWVRAVNSMVCFRNHWDRKRINDARKIWDACLIAQEDAMNGH